MSSVASLKREKGFRSFSLSPSSFSSTGYVMITQLPVEVYERIIDFIGDEHLSEYGYDHTKTLLACCLTCRSLFPRSSKYLFTIVRLKIPRITTFSTFLGTHSHIGKSVQTLALQPQEGHSQRELSLLTRDLPWRLPNLTRIIFYDVDFGRVYPTFSRELSKFTRVSSIYFDEAKFISLHQFFQLTKAFQCLDTFILYAPTFHNCTAGNPLSTPLTHIYKHMLHVQTVDVPLQGPNDVHKIGRAHV